MRPPVDDIPAPPFPKELEWVNVAPLRMDQQLGRPVLVEFWDFCRVNSLRTLPYVQEWHRRYADAGLRVVGVHASGFQPSADPDAVRAACSRLGVEHPVVIDSRYEIWDFYGNRGWPARYLWNAEGILHSFHYGEGAYEETEREIQGLLEVEREPLAPVRPEDDPAATLAAQTEDQEGAYNGPYEAGGVWGVFDRPGTIRVNGAEKPIDYPGCHELVRHERHTAAELTLELEGTIRCHAVCFTPGLAT
jgi:hypothetical protein